MQIIAATGQLDWRGWIRGVVGAFVSGGAASIAAGFAALKLDHGHDLNILELMGWTFLISGVVSLAKFLQTQPVPNVLQENLEAAAVNIDKAGAAVDAAKQAAQIKS